MNDDWEYWIEPLGGWKYGFPKRLPSHLSLEKIYEWLPANGYPKKDMAPLFDFKVWRKKATKLGEGDERD